MKDETRAKLVFDELTLEDLIKVFRKKAEIIVATKEDYYTETYDAWDTRTTFSVTNSDGETEEEQDDNGDFVLFNENSEGPTFKLKQKVKLKGNKVYLVDDHYHEYTLELYKALDLGKMFFT
jgi:hypothetical protein